MSSRATRILRSVLGTAFLLPGETLASAAFPGKTWETRTPQEAGLDPSRLDHIRDYLGGRGFIARSGHEVYTWGDVTQRGDVASAAKPVYATFLFLAVEEGLLSRLDEKVAAYEPCLLQINEELDFPDRHITFRHLATQTSNYQLRARPGRAFSYNDWQMALFFDTLMYRVYGVDGPGGVDREVLLPRLMDVLGAEDAPTFLAFGTDDRPGRLSISPRDFARFGHLYLNRGNWNGTQVLSEAHATMAVSDPLPLSLPRAESVSAEMCPGQRTLGSRTRPDNQMHHHGSYSWTWWVNGERGSGVRLWPDAPADVHAALGHRHGRRGLAVVPEMEIVISWNDSHLHRKPWIDPSVDPHPLNEVFRLLEAAGTAPSREPLPGQVVADAENPRWLRYAGGGPFFLAAPGDPEDFLYRGKRNRDGTRAGDQDEIIEKLAGTGANGLYVQGIRSHGGDGARDHNPFLDSDPSRGVDMDILNQWEEWFGKMDENGIVTFFFFYDDAIDIAENLRWPLDDAGRLHPGERRYIETVVDSFEHHRHLIWVVMEEVEEMGSDYVAHARAIADAIRRADDHDHVIAVHRLDGLKFDEFAADPNVDQFAIQYNKRSARELHDGVVTAWRRAAGRYNLNLAESKGHEGRTGAALRHRTWAVALGGAYVMALGMDVRGTHTADLEDLGRLRTFLESTDLAALAPRDDLALGGTQYVLAAPGRSYVAYCFDRDGDIGLRGLPPGAYDLRWFDPASGSELEQKGRMVREGDAVWARPEGFRREVALHVRRSAAPGGPGE